MYLFDTMLTMGAPVCVFALLACSQASPTKAPPDAMAAGGVGGAATVASVGSGGAASCPQGSADCDGDPANGCEANIGLPNNCGACGVKCSAEQHCGPGCNGSISCYPSPTNCPVNPCEGEVMGAPCSSGNCVGTCETSFGSSLSCACKDGAP